MAFQSTKTYGHNLGFSCAFRQWRADSHCKYIHGYSVAVKFVFEADELDKNNWVVDFGSLKSLKGWLETMFDHKTLVALNDPEIAWFEEAHKRGIIDMVMVPGTGCEMFAKIIYDATEVWLTNNGYTPRCRLVSVEVMEHGANSAVHTGGSDE
jgi:6-pyruvoyltetrahydropterin/6-carboxytetrahydropterin synthase